MTPEGRVKEKVRKMLMALKVAYSGLYTYWPVPAGFGPSSLDLIICANGHFIGVETKAPGKKPTPRQQQCIREMEAAGGKTFVVDGDASLRALETHLVGILTP